MRRRVIKNSIANVLTGFSVALTAVFVPPVLARTLTPMEFGAWALLLQIASYVSILDLGIQGAIGRYIAHYIAQKRRDAATSFINNAITVLSIASAVGLLAVIGVDINLHALFPQLPGALLPQSRVTLLFVGLGISLGLPASTFRGILTGIERYELVTLVAAPAGVFLSASLVALAIRGFGIVALGLAFFFIKALTYVAYWTVAIRVGRFRIRASRLTREATRELWGYCSSTILWSIGGVMASGFDVAVVARVDFVRVAAYAACVAPITIMAGAQVAMFRPLLQVGARLCAEGEDWRLPGILEKSTRISVIALMASAVPGLLFSREILTIWLGARYATQATSILRFLLIGQAIRLVATPYATLLLATNRHRVTRVPAIAEAIANAIGAIAFGIKFGATGVACGSVLGAIVGQLMNVFYNYPRTRDLVGSGVGLLQSAVLVPVTCFLPILAFPLVKGLRSDAYLHWAVGVAATLISAAGLWKFATRQSERKVLVSIARRAVGWADI